MKPILLAFAALCSAPAQDWQPNVTNARLETRAFSGNLSAQLKSDRPVWFGYAEKSARAGYGECHCNLEGRWSNRQDSGRIHLEPVSAVAILVRVSAAGVEKIQVYPLSCQIDAGGMQLIWLAGVPAETSLAFLETHARSDTHPDGALLAISLHGDARADAILIHFARAGESAKIREQALFWLAQKAGERAAATIENAIRDDPDTEVRKQAVFALSQMPPDEGVPRLIEVARNQRNPEVRKQAFFWLGQSRDSRALEFIERVLEAPAR